MLVHLDTNYLILGFQPGTRAAANLRAWAVRGDQVRVSSIAWSEFLCGAVAAVPPEDVRRSMREAFGEPVPFLAADAEITAELYIHSGRRRGSLADCQIAAVALREGAQLATEDRAAFERLLPAGLHLTD